MIRVILEVDEKYCHMAKNVFFYGDYDARNMRPEKSRDLGG